MHGHDIGAHRVRLDTQDETVNEAHFAEIEKTPLYINEALRRAERAAKLIAKDGADPRLVDALERRRPRTTRTPIAR